MADDETIWSPLEQMLKTAKKLAAIPDEVRTAAVPPSISHTFAATMSQVGF